MSYDGFEMFRKRLRGEEPSAATTNGHGGPEEPRRGLPGQDQPINPKLKQFFDVKTKIEPFYTGGKLSVLSPSLFLAKCGETVKLISTEEISSKIENNSKDEPEAKPESDDAVEADGDVDEDAKPEKPGSFGVIGNFESELDEIISFDGCPLSNALLTAHKSQLIRVWNLRTSEIERTIRSNHQVPISIMEIHRAKSEHEFHNVEDVKGIDSCIHLRSQLCWTTVAGNILKIWDGGGSIVSKSVRIDGIASIGFVKWDYTQKNGSLRLLVAERNIYVIELDPGSKAFQISKTLEGHYSQVTGIEWGVKDLMISGGRDKTIILWNTKDDAFTQIKTLAFPGVIESMTLLSGKDLFVAASPGLIRHLDILTNKLSTHASLPWSDEESIAGFHCAHNAEEFFITTHANSIYQVGRREGSKKKEKRLKINKQFVGSLDEIMAVALWGEDKVAVATNTSAIKVYDLQSGSCEFLRGHVDIVLSLAVKGDLLVSGSKDNRIMIWSSDSLEPQHTLSGHLGSVSSVCFHPDKLPLRIYSVADDNFLKAWDENKCLHSVIAHDKEVHAVDCSPKGNLLATASRDKTAKIWDSKSLKLKAVLKGHKKSVWDVKFSTWDQLVVTASADSTLKIWNLITNECIQTLQGHTSSVLQGRFFNMGLQIFSSSTDGTWKTWDIRSSVCLSTLEASDDKIWALDATSDGSIVATGTTDSVLTIWKDITDEKIKESVEKKKKWVEDDQKLNNVLRKGDWSGAIRLAIELDRPFTLLKIIRGVSDVKKELEPTIAELPLAVKMSLVDYIRKWNTNTKTSTEAQVILNILLTTSPPEDLEFLDTTSFIAYTNKHFQRLQKAQQYVALVNYLAESEP